MPAYRLYRVDHAGKILAAEWLEAEDDAGAIDAARASAGERYEIWQRQRLVLRVEPNSPGVRG